MRLEPYKIGEEAILVNMEKFPEYEGTKCTIIGNLTMRQRINETTMKVDGNFMCYKVLTNNGLQLGPRPDQLKPKVGSPDKIQEIEEVY